MKYVLGRADGGRFSLHCDGRGIMRFDKIEQAAEYRDAMPLIRYDIYPVDEHESVSQLHVLASILLT